jgi:uncharacterized membrane protein
MMDLVKAILPIFLILVMLPIVIILGAIVFDIAKEIFKGSRKIK